MQVNPNNITLAVVIVICFAIAAWIFSREHSSQHVAGVAAKFGTMNGYEIEVVSLPPFISGSQIENVFKSFIDRDNSATRTSLSSDYIYFFSITIGGSDFRVYLNKKAQLANEFQNPAGAQKIRDLLFYSKGPAWFNERFTTGR